MSSSLQLQVAAARRRIRRLLLVYGASRVLGIVVAAAILLAGSDYLLRFEDRGVRVICSLAIVGLAAWGVRRFLIPAARQPLGDVVVGQGIERHFNGLGELFSSTVEFLRLGADDPLAGSASLRRAAVEQAEAAISPLDWRRAVDRRPALRAAALAAGICLVATGLVAARPAGARLALIRLATPLGSDAWPPVNRLEFTRHPERIARDQPFEVELVDRNHNLPAEVRIQYRRERDDGTVDTQQEQMQRIGDTMIARKDRVTSPFDYRAEGGDDRKMPWTHVELVEPPRIDSLEITLHPSPYTGWPDQPGQRRLVALRGTVVEMKARCNKPLVSATLHQENGPDAIGQVSDDGLGFAISRRPPTGKPLVIEKSGPYWFELRDREGLIGGLADRWEIEAIGDQPPSVNIEQPAGDIKVTPGATVPIRVIATDDLAIHTVALIYNRSDRIDLTEIGVELFKGPDQAPRSTGPPQDGSPAGARREIPFAWELGPLGLRPGAVLLLNATATDYFPQTGTSSPRRITIITPEQLDEILAQRESVVFGELSRILKLQQEARQQTAGLQTQLEQVGQLARPDVDQLRGDELNQRQIRRSLVGQTEGIRNIVVGLLDELAGNHVENLPLRRRMQSLANGLAQLDRGELPAAESALAAALAEADGAAPSRPPTGRALAGALHNQDGVAAALEQMLGDLVEWNSFRGLSHDLAQIRRDMADVEKSTQELGAKTLAQDPRDLAPQQQADLKKLAERQLELARQFDKVRQRMEQVAGQLQKSEPLSAGALADALDVARRQSPGGLMRDAGQNIEQNRIGQTASLQAAADRALDEMLDTLSSHRDRELAGLVAKLKEAEAKLAGLQHDEAGLHRKLRESMASANKTAAEEHRAALERLATQQRELQRQTERLARELQRLQAAQPARSTARAADRMDRASQAAQTANDAAAESAVAAAEQSLDEAQRQLAEARRKAEADLAHQQLARLDDTVQSLIERQQQTLDETVRLENLRAGGELTRGQAQSVLDLARQQQALAEETGQLAAKLVGVEAFQFLLESAAGNMLAAGERLAVRDTSDATQQIERDVIARLGELVAALKAAPPKSSPPAGEDAGSGGGNSAAKPGPSLAEIRLVRLMQDDLNRRTRRLGEAIGAGKQPAPSQRTELADLTREQGRLAELVRSIAARVAGNSGPAGESTPDDLQRSEPPQRPAAKPDSKSSDEASLGGTNGGEDIGSPGEAAHQDPLSLIARQMRDVKTRLADGKPDEVTQRKQKKIVADLEKLLDQLAQQEQQRRQDEQSQRTSARSKVNQPDQPGQTSKGPPGKTSQNSLARNSAERSASNPAGKLTAEALQLELGKLFDGLGLPAKDRDTMLESAPDQFLPGHESSISRYFQRLIEDEERDSRD